MWSARRSIGSAVLVLLVSACSQTFVPSADETTHLLPQSLGTSSSDYGEDVAVSTELGAVFVTGSTYGSLDGTNRGGEDVFLRRYTRGGKVVWKRQVGSALDDTAGGVVVSPGGAVYVGYTQQGTDYVRDGVLQKFSAVGALQWVRRFTVDDYDTSVTSVATDSSGNVFVGGTVDTRAFVRKYSSSGAVLWTYFQGGFGVQQRVTGLATDSAGNVYAGGRDSDDESFANFLIKLSSSGEPLFETQLSTRSIISITDVRVAGGALYVAGFKVYNNDNPDLETTDAFLGKYTLGGTEQWRRVFGTPSGDRAHGLSADASGGLYLTGITFGNFGGGQPRGSDAFLRKYTSGGQALWTKQIGSAGIDYGNAVAAYSSSELYLTGTAGGALVGGTYRGAQDAFLRRTDGAGNRVWTDQ